MSHATVFLPVPPKAVDDIFPQSDTGPTTVPVPGVLVNDAVSPSCRATAVLTVTSGPAHGTVVLNNNGKFVYTPSVPGQRLDDEYTYQINCNGMVSAMI